MYMSLNYPWSKRTQNIGDNGCLGINHRLDVVGACSLSVDGPPVQHGYSILASGMCLQIDYPNADVTVAHGVNNYECIVGHYKIQGKTHGFCKASAQILFPLAKAFQDVSFAKHDTTLNGINDAGDMVGFYMDIVGHEQALLVRPDFTPVPLSVNIPNRAVLTARATAIDTSGARIVGHFTEDGKTPHPFVGTGPFG